MFGKKSGEYKEFIFSNGEAITSLQLWGNGEGTRTGRIEFSTDNGRSFGHGKEVSGQTGFPNPDLGSGILIRLVSRSGAKIDCLGFVFLRKVDGVRITNVEYPTPPAEYADVTTTVLDRADLPVQDIWQFRNSVGKEETTTFSQTATMSFGTTATINAGVPGTWRRILGSKFW